MDIKIKGKLIAIVSQEKVNENKTLTTFNFEIDNDKYVDFIKAKIYQNLTIKETIKPSYLLDKPIFLIGKIRGDGNKNYIQISEFILIDQEEKKRRLLEKIELKRYSYNYKKNNLGMDAVDNLNEEEWIKKYWNERT